MGGGRGLGVAFLILWALGWLGLIGWFVLDTFGFEIRRKQD
jgi:hypothetical protein